MFPSIRAAGARLLAPGLVALVGACGAPVDDADLDLEASGTHAEATGLVGSQVFLAPNVGSLDLLDMFRRPELWATARSRLSVFKFYQGQLQGDGSCGATNGINLESLRAVGAFDLLREWRLGVAIEVPAIKGWDCSGLGTADQVLDTLRRLTAAGVTIGYLSMDEPFASGITSVAEGGCGLDGREVARRVAEHIRIVRAEFPDVAYGSMDAYPLLTAGQIRTWLQDLEAEGTPLDYEHLDVDFNYVKGANVDLHADFSGLAQFCRDRGIAFGPMTTANEAGSPGDHAGQNRFFYDTVMTEIGQVMRAMGRPDQVVLPSWFNTCGTISSPCSGTNCLIVPDLLPETEPYTFTRLLLDALDVYDGTTPPPPESSGGGCHEQLNLLTTASLGLVLVAPAARRRRRGK